MNNFHDKLSTVLDVLESSSSDLRELARIAGRNPFSFYQGADLSGLNLSRQDFRGMNFDRADLRSANLEGIIFDPGAFNGSNLSKEFKSLSDSYDTYLSDILITQVKRIYIFGSFREISLDKCFEIARISYNSFAENAGIGVGTLRKARRGEIVSPETIISIAHAMTEFLELASAWSTCEELAISRQPMIQILSLRPNGGFNNISHKNFLNTIELSIMIDRVRYGRQSDRSTVQLWRSSPESLAWIADYYYKFDSMLFTDEELQLEFNGLR